MSDNPLWDYSLEVYRHPGVEPLLLEMQERFGADVNLLLACCWLAHCGQVLTDSTVQATLEAIGPWRRQCVEPLRGVRRFLKECPGAEALRQRVKSLELEAEAVEQDRLLELLQHSPAADRDGDRVALALRNLRLYAGTIRADQRRGFEHTAARLAELTVAG